jgi:Zn-dependent protease
MASDKLISTKSTPEPLQYEQIRRTVEETGFTIEEGLLEYDVPTFYVTLKPDIGQAFLKLYKELKSKGLVPILRKREDKTTLQIILKPPVRPNRPGINIALLLITVIMLLITGYVLSSGLTGTSQLIGAIMFTTAIMSILGSHEMAHKLSADRHGVDATYPYFIPGPPAPIGIGTFGAVIQQKSLAPNKDALFDIGMSGPIVGFLVAIIVSLIGIQISKLISMPLEGAGLLSTPLAFDLLMMAFPPSGQGNVILLHPVAFAGWVGMVVTMLNLIPVGQMDGGHIARAILKDRNRTILAFIAIAILFLFYWPGAIMALFLIRYSDPGPLDDVSSLSKGRKLATALIILVFILTTAPYFPLI